MACRGKTKKERAFSFLSTLSKSVDSSFTNHTDTDEFYEHQKSFIVHYNALYVEVPREATHSCCQRSVPHLPHGPERCLAVSVTLAHCIRSSLQH